MTTPALILCAHGTDDPEGRRTTSAIANEVSARLDGVAVTTAYADLQAPTIAAEVDRVEATGSQVVVVPLVLIDGPHLTVDIADAVNRHPGRVVSTGLLGPDELLIDVVVDRLREAGAKATTPVVVGISGPNWPSVTEAADQVATDLRDRWVGDVKVGFLSSAGPRLSDVVAETSAKGPVAVASYVVARGYAQSRMADAGAAFVAEPLGAHPCLIELVVQKYQAGVELLRLTSAA